MTTFAILILMFLCITMLSVIEILKSLSKINRRLEDIVEKLPEERPRGPY